MTGISVNKKIYQILSGDTQLSGVTFYPIIAPEETKFPFLVYRRDEIDPIYAKNIACGDSVLITITIVDVKYSTTVTYAERVRELLELRKDDYFKGVVLTDSAEGWEDNGYFQKLKFKCTIFKDL